METSRFHRYKEFRLNQMRAFCECVRKKTFSAAARALQMSPSAVWQQVRALERDFGVCLLQQRGKEWQPSEEGQVLLELASSIVGSMDSLKEAFDRRCRAVTRTLTVIGSPSVITEELVGPAADFARQYPHIKVTLLHFAGLGTLDLLLDGEADVAILPIDLDVAYNGRFLISEPFSERVWVLIMMRGHPLEKKRRLALGDLIRYPLILPQAGSEAREFVDGAFRAADLLGEMRISLEVSLSLAARRFVNLGLGIAIFPKPWGGVEFPELRERPLSQLMMPERVAAFWRSGARQRPQARLFVDFAREWIASHANEKARSFAR